MVEKPAALPAHRIAKSYRRSFTACRTNWTAGCGMAICAELGIPEITERATRIARLCKALLGGSLRFMIFADVSWGTSTRPCEYDSTNRKSTSCSELNALSQ